jgi:outer membrane biogenesis lipoprotein LolB
VTFILSWLLLNLTQLILPACRPSQGKNPRKNQGKIRPTWKTIQRKLNPRRSYLSPHIIYGKIHHSEAKNADIKGLPWAD